MQELEESIVEEATEAVPAISLLDLPVAKLQIVQTGHILKDDWPTRPGVEPKLAQTIGVLCQLTIRRQGEHGKFDVSYIGTEILLADAEMGLIVCLVGYHGTETYGRKSNKRVQKGQFYRYYQQQASGDWHQLVWREFNDEMRGFILALPRPDWARTPGKLSSERKPPAKMVEMTSYKTVRLIDGRYYSLYDPTVEYVIGQRMKQAAKPGHESGYFSYPTQEDGVNYLEGCIRYMPFHSEVVTPALALLECEIGGRIINYGHKLCSTYLMPVRVVEVRELVVV